jgi:ribulose-phosphate 3-epimerase
MRTMPRLRLSPSILTADFGRLAEEVKAVSPYVDWFHLDVMDGHYVDNITFGPSTVEAIRRSCEQPLHVHLMIEDPSKYVQMFVDAGADRVSFHPEVVKDPAEVIAKIRTLGAGPGLAVHPDVGFGAVEPFVSDLDVVLMMTVRPGFGGQAFLEEVIPDIERAKYVVTNRGHSAEIEVDGGVNLSTVGRAVAAGGEILVSGSAVFDGVDPGTAAKNMRERLNELEAEGQ